MNKDQFKGEGKHIAGKTQETAGKMTGSDSQQRKGLERQNEGNAEKRLGDTKEANKGTNKRHH